VDCLADVVGKLVDIRDCTVDVVRKQGNLAGKDATNMRHLTALKMNPNGIQIHQPKVGNPSRTGEERLPWETVPQIHQR
jgi:hypothetical protein